MTKPWPPGYTPQPPDAPAKHPLRYLRMRQTQIDNGVTGTMTETFKAPSSNIADTSKGRVQLPKGRK